MDLKYHDFTLKRLSVDTTLSRRGHHRHHKMRLNLFSFLLPLLIFLVILSSLFLFIFHSLTNSKKTQPTTKAFEYETPVKENGKLNNNLDKEGLLLRIRQVFENKVGTYGIYIYDPSTDEDFGINEEAVFTAASVAKVPILATLYHLADQGEIDLDDTRTMREQDIQDFGTGILRYQRPGSSYSLKTLARLMMEKSDNTAAHMLGRIVIGFPKIDKLMESWGLTQTDMNNNKTSAKDMGILMVKMYRTEIASQSLTREMLGFMRDTDFEDRLPALLPKDVTVYHKTGDEVGNAHDVGIVELPEKTYFIGILALDLLTGEDEAKRAIAEASLLVYQYFSGKIY